MNKKLLLFSTLLLVILSCRSTYTAKPYDFPKPVDTKTKAISLQEKKVYSLQKEGVSADNLFDGARLNNFQHLSQDTFQATISPENKPINLSAYYAFRLWSSTPKDIVVELNYTYGFHRYPPKISKDGKNWQVIDSLQVQLATDSINAFVRLSLNTDTLWVAAQELQTSADVTQWCQVQAKQSDVIFHSIGKSKLGRSLPMLEILEGSPKGKDIIAILSRQHPPEVTGYFAMQAFIEEILADKPLSNNFRKKYHLLVYPLMNPDGVDLGHWRHSAGGIDLNRDWAYYNQPENLQVANSIVKIARTNKAKVILGLDFHSTWYDIFYTNKQPAKNLPQFKDYWLGGIKNALSDLEIKERPSNIGGPVSKNWFLTQLDAEGITYEIGDNTPRNLIKVKGTTSAIEMMQLLIYK